MKTPASRWRWVHSTTVTGPADGGIRHALPATSRLHDEVTAACGLTAARWAEPASAGRTGVRCRDCWAVAFDRDLASAGVEGVWLAYCYAGAPPDGV